MDYSESRQCIGPTEVALKKKKKKQSKIQSIIGQSPYILYSEIWQKKELTKNKYSPKNKAQKRENKDPYAKNNDPYITKPAKRREAIPKRQFLASSIKYGLVRRCQVGANTYSMQ